MIHMYPGLNPTTPLQDRAKLVTLALQVEQVLGARKAALLGSILQDAYELGQRSFPTEHTYHRSEIKVDDFNLAQNILVAVFNNATVEQIRKAVDKALKNTRYTTGLELRCRKCAGKLAITSRT